MIESKPSQKRKTKTAQASAGLYFLIQPHLLPSSHYPSLIVTTLCQMTTTVTDWPGRYDHLDKILTRTGGFTDPDFSPGSETQDFLRNKCKVLVIGKVDISLASQGVNIVIEIEKVDDDEFEFIYKTISC